MTDLPTTDDPSATDSAIAAAMRTFYRAWSEDPELLDTVLADGWEDIPLNPGQGPGAEGAKAMIRGLRDSVPDAELVVHDIVEQGSSAAVRAELRGTHSSELFGVPATGTTFSVPIHEFHQLDASGRITRTWHLEDWFGWLHQVGAWPAQPRTTMAALRVHAHGSAPQLDEVAVPSPGAGEVLVRVVAAAFNPLDAKMQRGSMRDFFPVELPYVLGTDLSGVVEGVGDGVDGFVAGDRVLARTDPRSGGAFAELVTVPAAQVVTVPPAIDLVHAAATPTAAATAWQALVEAADLQPGQRILIHGGAGGVGSFAVQLAKQLGAHVLTTASGAGVGRARSLGADEVIDHTTQDFTEVVGDVDVVIDTIGGDVEERSLSVLRPGGLLVALPVPPDEQRAADRGLRAAFVVHESDGPRLGHVVRRIAESDTEILVGRHLLLSEAATGWEHLTGGGTPGKTLLLPSR